MQPPSQSDITLLLHAWTGGDQDALNRLMPIVSRELKQIAGRKMATERIDHTLEAAALVNEAYIRLVDIRHVHWQDRAHFFAVCASLMRRILVDHARYHAYDKRGGNRSTFSLAEPLVGSGLGVELLDLDRALTALGEFDTRKVEIAQLRFFAGLTAQETAAVLGVSIETVHRDWKISKAWLARKMTEPIQKSTSH